MSCVFCHVCCPLVTCLFSPVFFSPVFPVLCVLSHVSCLLSLVIRVCCSPVSYLISCLLSPGFVSCHTLNMYVVLLSLIPVPCLLSHVYCLLSSCLLSLFPVSYILSTVYYLLSHVSFNILTWAACCSPVFTSLDFLHTLGVKSGYGMTPQLHRPRASWIVGCMVAGEAFLLRASAWKLFLGFFLTVAKIVPIRRH